MSRVTAVSISCIGRPQKLPLRQLQALSTSVPVKEPQVEHPAHEGFDDLDLAALRRRPGVKWARVRPDGDIAAWVADMDFPPCPAVADRLREVLDTGDLGYPNW